MSYAGIPGIELFIYCSLLSNRRRNRKGFAEWLQIPSGTPKIKPKPDNRKASRYLLIANNCRSITLFFFRLRGCRECGARIIHALTTFPSFKFIPSLLHHLCSFSQSEAYTPDYGCTSNYSTQHPLHGNTEHQVRASQPVYSAVVCCLQIVWSRVRPKLSEDHVPHGPSSAIPQSVSVHGVQNILNHDPRKSDARLLGAHQENFDARVLYTPRGRNNKILEDDATFFSESSNFGYPPPLPDNISFFATASYSRSYKLISPGLVRGIHA
jgi:hypothetical protein